VRFQITHTTRYQYQETVSQCHSVAHLLPRNTFYQQCTSAAIRVNPAPATGADRTDYFGNHSYHFSVQIPHRTLEITATSEVEITGERQNLALDFGSSCAEVRGMLLRGDQRENVLAREFTLDSPMVKVGTELADYARSSFHDDEPFLACVRDLTRRIFEEFTYDTRYTDVATPLTEVIRHRRGVCQDFAHLAIGCLRALGFPARYVSGYLETLPPPGSAKLEGADASHAWFSVYSPTGGWCDFDPTNNLLASRQHITTAWGRDYADVTPMKGTIIGGGASHALDVEVDVKRLDGVRRE
jgi:transglutaminase-like putative cysteine protease